MFDRARNTPLQSEELSKGFMGAPQFKPSESEGLNKACVIQT